MLRGLASDKILKRTRLRKWLHRRLGDDKRIPLTTKLKKYVSRKMEKKYMQQNVIIQYKQELLGKYVFPIKNRILKRGNGNSLTQELLITMKTSGWKMSCLPSLPSFSIKCQKYHTFNNSSWTEHQKRFSKYWRVRLNIYLTRS